MARTDYIPKNDSVFLDWAERLVSYSISNHGRWSVGAPGSELIDLLGKYRTAYSKFNSANSGKIDLKEKNDAKKELSKACRTYVQGFLAKNPYVNNSDKQQMGLPIYEKSQTPIGDPVGIITATINYPNDGALEVNMRHVEGSPFDKRANYGIKIRSGVFPIDHPSPNEVGMLSESRFTRRKRELFVFDKQDRKKIAYFCFRYENAKGKAGQWSSIISAVIP